MVAHGVSRGLSVTRMMLARRATLRSTFDLPRCVALRAAEANWRSPTAHAVGYLLPPSGLGMPRRTSTPPRPLAVGRFDHYEITFPFEARDHC